MTTTRKWRRWLKYGVFLALLVLLATAFVPMPVDGRQGTVGEAARCRSKLSRLWTATQANSGQGTQARAAFTEGEINAYLASVLESNPRARKAQGLTVGIDDLRVATHQGEARLFVVGRLARLPFVLECRTNSATGASAGRCHSVRLGRLPLLPPLNWIAMRQLKRLARGLTMEAAVLRQLSALTVEDNRIKVEIRSSGD